MDDVSIREHYTLNTCEKRAVAVGSLHGALKAKWVSTMIEQRRSRRIDSHLPAAIMHNNSVYFAQVCNLSNCGAYLKTHIKYYLNQDVDLSIYLRDGKTTLSVTVPSKVVRADADGIGLYSPHLDVSMLIRIEGHLSFHKGNFEQITAELFQEIMPINGHGN